MRAAQATLTRGGQGVGFVIRFSTVNEESQLDA
jgi:hypothetical protein